MKRIMLVLVIVGALFIVACDDGSKSSETPPPPSTIEVFSQNFDGDVSNVADWNDGTSDTGRSAVAMGSDPSVALTEHWIVTTAGDTVSVINGALNTNSTAIGSWNSAWYFDLSNGGNNTELKKASFDITQTTGAALNLKFQFVSNSYKSSKTWNFIAEDGTTSINLDLTTPDESDTTNGDFIIWSINEIKVLGNTNNDTLIIDNIVIESLE